MNRTFVLLSAADENKLVNTVKTKQNRSNTDELKGGNDEVPLHMFLNWSRSFLPEQLRCFRRNRARQTQISRAELVLNASLSIHFLIMIPERAQRVEWSRLNVPQEAVSFRIKTLGCVITVPAGSVWIHWSRNSPDSDPELVHCCLPPPSPPTRSCDCGDDSWHHSYKIRARGWRRGSSCGFLLSLTVCFAGSLSLCVSSERFTASLHVILNIYNSKVIELEGGICPSLFLNAPYKNITVNSQYYPVITVIFKDKWRGNKSLSHTWQTASDGHIWCRS